MASFYTDVIEIDPRFDSVDRIDDPNLLEPVTRRLVRQIVVQAKAMGLDVTIYETYRSQARQRVLFSQHVTQLENVGVHHYGLACDIVMLSGGEPSWEGDFSFLGRLAHSDGLIWGGDWGNPNSPHSFIDPHHVQRCTVARQADLFAGNWYPDGSYDPYRDISRLRPAREI